LDRSDQRYGAVFELSEVGVPQGVVTDFKAPLKQILRFIPVIPGLGEVVVRLFGLGQNEEGGVVAESGVVTGELFQYADGAVRVDNRAVFGFTEAELTVG